MILTGFVVIIRSSFKFIDILDIITDWAYRIRGWYKVARGFCGSLQVFFTLHSWHENYLQKNVFFVSFQKKDALVPALTSVLNWLCTIVYV